MQLNLDLMQMVQRQALVLIIVLNMAGYLVNEAKQQRQYLLRQQKLIVNKRSARKEKVSR